MTGRRRRASAVAALLVLGALVLGGCGIPISHSALPVSANLPPELNGGSSPTTTSTPPTSSTLGPHEAHLEIYLVSPDGLLYPVRRPWQPPVTPVVALGVLGLGPYPADTKKNLTTAIPPNPRWHVSVHHSIASVTLNISSFGDLFGSSLYIPLAQVVYTLMSDFPSIKGVNFYLGGLLFNYTPSGSTSPSPVTEGTYAALKPLPSSKS